MPGGAFVIRSDGSRNSAVSKECPKCAQQTIKSEVSTSPDFDENGWFYPTQFECTNAKCRHKWKERIVVMTGGWRS